MMALTNLVMTPKTRVFAVRATAAVILFLPRALFTLLCGTFKPGMATTCISSSCIDICTSQRLACRLHIIGNTGVTL